MALALTALIIVSAFAAVPFTASAAESRTESVGAKSGTTGDCTWTLDDEGVLTISGNGDMGDYDTSHYDKIAPWGESITSVIIENGVTSIGSDAFSDCIGLTSVTIPDSVTSIGSAAFYGCTGMTSVTIPDSVTSIGLFAFYGCSGLTSIDISNSVTSIDDFVFANCTGLTSVTIPDSVTSIHRAFEGCTALTNIIIPDSVTSISIGAFFDTAWYNNRPDGLVYAGKVAYNYKGEMPENTSIIIKDGTKGIADSAFSQCKGLTSITFPDSLNIIGISAFFNCTGLSNVTINNGVTIIAERAFYHCNRLTSVIIPDSVKTIGDSAFKGCTGLASVTISEEVTSVGRGAFSNTNWFNNLPDGMVYLGKVAYCYKGEMPENTSVEIKDGTKKIADAAFSGCTGLTGITIPDSVQEIGIFAFSGCSGLTNIDIPDSVIRIGYCAFNECTGLTDIPIPKSVTKILYSTFSTCTGLTDITIPDSVVSIGDWSFASCSNLKSVTIPNSVTSIYYNAFLDCNNLKSVTIPPSVTHIGENAFGYYRDDDNWETINVDGFTIYGYEGSQAQKYAENNGFEFVKLVSKEDEHTGITLDTPEEMSVSATLLSGQEAADAAKPLPGGLSTKAVYNIAVTKNGEVVQPENIVKVMIPCNNENARVFRKEADGALTDMNAAYQDGCLVFYTDNFSVYVVAEEQTAMMGDTNGDEKIDINDVTVIQRCMAEYIELTAELEAVADVNGDDKVDINDATHLQKYLAEFQGFVLGKQ